MAAALASGRQRQLLAEAQGLAGLLKALPPSPECSDEQVRAATFLLLYYLE